METIVPYKEEFKKYIPEQYKNSEKLLALVNSCMAQFDDLETAFFEILQSLNLADAIGPALDYLGAIVGVKRNPGESDTQYRERIVSGLNLLNLPGPEALFNHDPNFVLGRNKAGTLELEEDEIGLRVVITPPDTSWANDLIKNLRRGDISQMSIGFIVLEDSWGTQDGIDIREIKKVQLFDVSIVTYPAYTQTDVGVRAMESYKDYRSKLDEAQNAAKRAKEKQKLQNIKTKIKNL